MSKGFIKLPREVMEHWTRDDLEKWGAFVDLIGLAAWKDCVRMVNNSPVKVQAGQIPATVSYLSRRWKWSNRKVRTFLDQLQTSSDIDKVTTSRLTMISLGSVWLGEDQRQGHIAESDKVTTSKRQASDNKRRTKKVKKERKEEERTPSAAAAKKILWIEEFGWDNISENDFAGWRKAYPSVDAKNELLKMHEWLLSNPRKRPKSDWRRFLTAWLARSQGDQPVAVQRPAKIEPPKEILCEAYEAAFPKSEYPMSDEFDDGMQFWGFSAEDRYRLEQASDELKSFLTK